MTLVRAACIRELLNKPLRTQELDEAVRRVLEAARQD